MRQEHVKRKRAPEKHASRLAAMPFRTKMISLAVIAVLFSFSFPIICRIAGNNFGRTVGAAVGSFQAVTEDMPEAYNQGKEDGLSAKDTRVELQAKMQAIGKLDVLAANATLHNMNKVGEKYAALYQFGADVIVSVDISKAKVLAGEGVTEIVLPKPEVELNIDSTKTKLLDYYQRGLFNGTSKDGLDEYFNSVAMLQQEAKDVLVDYDFLIERAEAAAKAQIKMIADIVTNNSEKITIRFDETAGEGQ